MDPVGALLAAAGSLWFVPVAVGVALLVAGGVEVADIVRDRRRGGGDA